MRKKIFNCILMAVGAIGACTFSLVSILNSQATDLLSIIPATMVCCSMFLAGYLSCFKEK